jgi:hypothetical protein
MAVLEPSGWPGAAARRRLQARGTALLAYLSVLEVPHMEPAVLRADGEPVRNPVWGNWVLDPRHPETERRVLATVDLLRNDGWDGLFLDTLDDAEIPELAPAAARLVAALAAAWPEGALVQNRGLGLLLPLTASFIQGVCWEDFPHARLAAGDPGFTRMARGLQTWSARGLHVLALNEEAAGGDVAEALGFPWYGAPGAYTALPPSPPAPSSVRRRGACCEPTAP